MERSRILRRVLLWTAGGLGLLAAVIGLLAWQSHRAWTRARAEFERRVGPVDHGHYVADQLPDERNRAVAFRAAMDGVRLDGDWTRALGPSAWRPEEIEQARALVDREEKALARLGAAAALEGCWWPASPAAELVWSGPMLEASRLLRIAAFVAVLDGDASGLEGAFDALGRLADCLYRQPHIVGSIVATAVDRARLEVVRAALATPDQAIGTEEHLAAGLESSRAEDRVAWALAAEGAFSLLFVEKPGVSGGRSVIYPLFSRRVAAHLAERWIALREWSDRPLEELLAGVGSANHERGPTTVIADLLIPNLREAVVKMRTVERLTGLALTAIAMRREVREKGDCDGGRVAPPALEVGRDAEGLVVLRDEILAAMLRQRYLSEVETMSPGLQGILALTTWRLPACAEEEQGPVTVHRGLTPERSRVLSSARERSASHRAFRRRAALCSARDFRVR